MTGGDNRHIGARPTRATRPRKSLHKEVLDSLPPDITPAGNVVPEGRGASRASYREPRPDGKHVRGGLLAETREAVAFDMYVRCFSMNEIANVMEVTPVTVWRIITRVLAKRAEREPEIIKGARGLLAERYEALLRVWYPRAVGDEGQGVAPNEKAARYVMDLLDRWGKIHGVDTAPPVHVTAHITIDPGQIQNEIMASLEAVENRVIQGTAVPASPAPAVPVRALPSAPS